MSLYALCVMNGQLKGKEILLSPEQELYIGRGAEQDIILKEDLVSRQHAKLTIFRDSIILEDLHSTNGTSVNELPVNGPRQLSEGDRITVGTCQMKLLRASDEALRGVSPRPSGSESGSLYPPNASVATPSPRPPAPPTVTTPSSSPLQARARRIETGQLPSEQVDRLFTLLSRLVGEQHDGVVILSDHDEREGNLYFRRGQIYFVSLEDPMTMAPSPPPREALEALFTWPHARYKVKPMSALPSFPSELREESRGLIREIERVAGERAALYQKLPPLDRPLQPLLPLEAPLSALSREELDFFQCCLNRYTLQDAARYHPQGELVGLRLCLRLLERGYLTPA